jgi:hypothetical protein
MSDQPIDFPDADYWEKLDDIPGQVSGQFLDRRDAGVAIGAPARVPIALRKTLPVVTVRFCETREDWAVPFDRHALLTAINLDENRVHAGYAGDQEAELPDVDPAEAPTGRSSSAGSLDARERLDLPWRAGTYLLTLILREQVSNRVRVELGETAQAFEDEEVAKFLAAKQAKLAPPAVSPPPGELFPTYQKRDDSPPIPDKLGIKLVADRVVVLRPDASCVLRGAFRLAPRPREVVKPAPSPGPAAPQAGPQATAIIGITLLITGAKIPVASLLRLNVPSYDPIPAGAETAPVTGYFTLDLIALGALGKTPQTSFIYAFSGEVLEGPVPAALISEDMLPK